MRIDVELIVRWLSKKIIRNIFKEKEFINLINNQIEQYYKTESLKCLRVWGDESRLHLGKDVQLNNALINTVSGDIFIDDYTFFGHSVSLLTGTHDHEERGVNRQNTVPNSGRDIHIGRGVWIGSNVTIIGPSRIGESAVIAAGSVLLGDAEAFSLYAGVPAVKIRKIKLKS